MFGTTRILVIAFGVIFTASGALAHTPVPEGGDWQELETLHTVIHYRHPSDLLEFNNKIACASRFRGMSDSLTSAGKDLEPEILHKVDALFERVQHILDMRKRMNKVIIRVYRGKEQLLAAYRGVCNRSFRSYEASASAPRAWYIYESNTIYVNVEDLRDGMLAHEIAHAVIDHYLMVRPPAATAEILAQYVDAHLFDDRPGPTPAEGSWAAE